MLFDVACYFMPALRGSIATMFGKSFQGNCERCLTEAISSRAMFESTRLTKASFG
jgi:hypothetical protein